MDPKHRDRVAFVRLASGHFIRGMKLLHVRTKKPMAIANPVMFLAADRELAEEAWAGDIIGIPNHGQLRIGDALTEGEALRFTGIPSFAPELLQTVRAMDPMKAKHLEKALTQFAEEGAAKVFKPMIGSGYIVGVVGAAAIRSVWPAGSKRNTPSPSALNPATSPPPAGCRVKRPRWKSWSTSTRATWRWTATATWSS